jgi:phenylalanyl-tRNA synthetase alpha chain
MADRILLDKEEEALKAIVDETLAALRQAQTLSDVEAIRIRVLGRKGSLNARLAALKDPAVSLKDRIELGKCFNEAKRQIEQALMARKDALSQKDVKESASLDVGLPGVVPQLGRIHPISLTIQRILDCFRAMGFVAVQGPEIETEWNNFDALNIPTDHPSRDHFDTFYLTPCKREPKSKEAQKGRYLLRSHTSPVQIRFMERYTPPFRIVVPGRVFRPDAVDASHSFQFHQVEGLAVEQGLTFADLKGVLTLWAQKMFGPSAQLKFRPHYFPFTEPSAEVDLACIFCKGSGCRVCGQKGWVEILGCGMVHPNVFRAVRYFYRPVGFAFGMGVERIAMLLYGIEDIRLFFENDIRFLSQFRF